MPPARVLLIEDEAILSIDEEMSLRQRGLDVHAVSSAERALQAVESSLQKSQPYDLASVDNHLSGKMVGYDFIRRLRHDTAFKAMRWLPIVVHSSDRLPPDLAEDPSIVYLPKGVTTADQHAETAYKMITGRD